MLEGPFRLALLALVAVAAHGQQPQGKSPVAFEVVSIKDTASEGVVVFGPGKIPESPHAQLHISGQRLTCELELRDILKEAFSITKDYLLAAPGWVDSEIYRIDAIMPAGTGREQARAMLQAMLRERLGLAWHHEARKLPVYALVEAKGGFKLHPVDADRVEKRPVNVPGLGAVRVHHLESPGRFLATAISLDDFCEKYLPQQIDLPVINETGIKGSYSIDLQWEWIRIPEAAGWQKNNPEFIGLLEERLGLKLEKRNLAVDVLVIDRVKREPTEN